MSISNMDSVDLIVSSGPVAGLSGYFAWEISGRSADRVRRAVDALIKDAGGPEYASFTVMYIVDDHGDPCHSWYRVKGYTTDNDKITRG